MDQDEVLRRLRRAYASFLIRDRQLLDLDANERSLTHKFAEHVQLEFPDWHVDCEYNRDRHLPKRLHLARPVSSDDTDGVTVFPDIVVHHRNTQDNLVVIEAKKSSSVGQTQDDEKLQAYVAELGYQFAVKVVFPVGGRAYEASAERDINVEPARVTPLGGTP